MQQTIILCPLYNDEPSFNIFAGEIEKQFTATTDRQFSFLVVNDGTSELNLRTKFALTVIHLYRNIGHQKAIALGLAYAHHHLSFDQIIVMDCDGEDRPEELRVLLEKATTDSGIIVAKRASRQETLSFQLFYKVYKLLFFILTGKRISFGNFMLLPRKETDKIVHYSEIWNHLAGAIIKSKIPYSAIDSHRGKRYEGRSKMNFTDLLLHGLGAIGVFIETIASRLLIFSLIMIGISIVAIVIVVFIRLFTTKAIPGWATTALSSMLIVLLQSFLLSLFTIFLFLLFQGQRKFIPALHFMDYVRSIETKKND